MTKKIVSATAVLIGAGSLLFGCSFEQATAGCIVQDHPSWLAFYELESVAPGCEESDAVALAGDWEPVGIFKYVNPEDRSDAKLAIRPSGLASRAVRDGDPANPEKGAQTAIGKMSTTPDAEEFCTASEFAPATVNDPGVANPTSGDPIEPANITYQFGNVSVLAAPNAPGTWMRGDLTYTRDGCTAKYKVLGIWPPIPCDPDAEVGSKDNCGEGSGANQDYNLVCHRDPDGAHYCKPDATKPVFKPEA